MADKVKLTEAQERILRKMGSHGLSIHYSSDGDNGWLGGEKVPLADNDIWALRNAGFLDREYDDQEDEYGCDRISLAGRAHLSSGSGKDD